jgi:DNA-binding transcriptional ArsR family regulator
VVERLDRVFSAISDPTRRAILARLAGGELTISEIAEPFDMSFYAVSKHIRVLENAGLIHRHIQGREHRCSLSAEPLREAGDWIENYRVFWADRLEQLERHVLQRRRRSRKGTKE